MVPARPNDQKRAQTGKHGHAEHDDAAASRQVVPALVGVRAATHLHHGGRGITHVMGDRLDGRNMMARITGGGSPAQHLVHREDSERKTQTQDEPQHMQNSPVSV